MLAAVFALGVLREKATAEKVAGKLGVGTGLAKEWLDQCVSDDEVEIRGGAAELTTLGRKRLRVVFIGGGFEVIHRGHLHTIERAKELGDVLVVSVARDSTIRNRKKREPLADEKERAAMLSSLRQVDAAILGVEGDIYETLEKVRPDVVALGYDQYHIERDIAREAKKRGMKLKVMRLDSPYPKMKTSAMLSET